MQPVPQFSDGRFVHARIWMRLVEDADLTCQNHGNPGSGSGMVKFGAQAGKQPQGIVETDISRNRTPVYQAKQPGVPLFMMQLY